MGDDLDSGWFVSDADELSPDDDEVPDLRAHLGWRIPTLAVASCLLLTLLRVLW
jgi:hypothetical protein